MTQDRREGREATIRLLLDGEMSEDDAREAARRLFEQAFADDAVVAGDFDVQPDGWTR